MASKIYTLLILFLALASANAQFSVKVQYGFVQDFYKLRAMPNERVFITGWQKFRQGNGFDGDTYNNLEVTYTWHKNKIGLRYRRNGLAYEHCYISGDANECFQNIREKPINLSLMYFRNLFNINSKLNFYLGSGIGTKQFYNIGYIDDSKKLLSELTRIIPNSEDGDVHYSTLEYLDESIFYIPLEMSFGYKFNKYFHLSLNLGYNYQLDNYSAKTDIEYYYMNTPNIKRTLSIFTSHEGYVGLGISIHFDIKKLKNKADEVKN